MESERTEDGFVLRADAGLAGRVGGLRGLLTWQMIRGQFARNTLWAVVGSAVSQASSLLAALMLGRMLGLTGFGQFALIQTTLLLMGNLGEAGLTLTTTKFVGRWKVTDPARAGGLMAWALRVTALSGVVMALLLFGVGRYSGAFAPGFGPAIFVAACSLLVFDMLNRVQLGALAGLEAFRETARIHLLRALLLLPAVWIGASFGGLAGAVTAMALISSAMFLFGHTVLAEQCRVRSIVLQHKARFESGVVATSASLWVCTLLLTGSTWIAMLLLSRQPAGFEELGLFSAAERWKLALLFLPNVLFQVILPALSRHHAAGNHRACGQVISAAMIATAGITGIAALLVVSASPLLMSWYGGSFQAGASVLSLSALGAIVSALYTVGSGVLWSLGRPTQMLGIDLFKTAVLLVLCAAGFAGSAWGLTMAYLLSLSAGCAVIIVFVHKQLRSDQSHAKISDQAA